VTDSGNADGFTAYVAGAVYRIRYASLPERVIERARHAVLDWLACTLAGSYDASARIGRELVPTSVTGLSSTIIGTKLRASVRDAAFVNSLSAHALDFDSSTPWAWGHPVVPLVAAAIALGEEIDASGAELVEAVVAGFEAATVIGLATATGLSTRGFHRTGTLGVFGAAAASGKLLGLQPRELQRAFTLAATQAAGLKLVLSTMGKSLNAARAAEAGVLAAKLVQRGFDAPEDAIEGEHGYAVAFEGSLDAAHPREIMQGRFGIENNTIKFHACCHAAHSTIEGIRQIRSGHAFTVEEVESISLEVPASALTYCGVMDPVTAAESMFSFPHAAALAVLGESTGPDGFSMERVRHPASRAARGKVRVIPDAATEHGSAPTKVRIALHSGAVFESCVSVFGETPEERLRAERLRVEEKFLDSAAPVLGRADALHVIESVADIAALKSVRDLTQLLCLR
jgi:2-methylcitrate dehydratase PrpD